VSAYKMSLAIEIPLCWALLFPPAFASQMLPQPGKLVINSEPTGATITINGKITNQPTNATFIVSPGTYTVSVAGEAGKPNCPGITITVSAGQTQVRVCSGTGWGPSQ
jgi:PEGA domain